ncbi:MAG: ATP-binding protein [Oligoflexus sp.]
MFERISKIFIVLFLLAQVPSFALFANIEAKHGVLDLRNWNFADDPTLSLNGDWEFYWDQFFTPEDFENQEVKKDLEWIRVPSSWHNTSDYPVFGKATYRLRILLPENHPNLVLNGLFASLSYRLFINNQLVKEQGDMSGYFGDMKSTNRDMIPLIPKDGIVEVIIQISNQVVFISGLPYYLQMGVQSKVEEERAKSLAIFSGLIASIFVIALYHFGIFALRPKDRSSLYFALFCMCVSIHTYCSAGMPKWVFSPEWAHESSYLVFNLTFILGVAVFFKFYFAIFPQSPGRWMEKLVVVVCISLASSFLFTVEVPPIILRLFQLFVLTVNSALIFFAFANIKNRLPGSILFVAGSLILLYGVINDMMAAAGIVQTFNIAPLTLFIFLIFKAFILSKKFSMAFEKVETSEKEIRLLHADLKERERARTIFFQNTSHELRTPLNGIVGFIDLMLNGRYGPIPELVSQQLIKVKNLSESLKEQVNTILDIAKSKKDGIKLSNSRINLASLEREISYLVESLKTKKQHINVSVQTSWEATNDQYFINDRDKLRTVIRNLISNAFKFTPDEDGNFIKISLKKDERNLVLSIQDSGIGIPKGQHEEVFQEFKQVDDDARRRYEGTGLGLTMVKQIIDLMQGSIHLLSDIGKGTTFSIQIPEQEQIHLQKVEENEIADETKPHIMLVKNQEKNTDVKLNEEKKLKHNVYHVLVVDDNHINCEVIHDILTAEGFQVSTAFDGRQGLDKIKSLKPDLVLLDLMMPEVSGEDVLKALKFDTNLNSIPIIVLTARASESDRIFGLALGADDYLAKPIASREMVLKVRNMLARIEKTKTAEIMDANEQKRQLIEIIQGIRSKLNTVNLDIIKKTTHQSENFLTLLHRSSLSKQDRESLGKSMFEQRIDFLKSQELQESMTFATNDPAEKEVLTLVKEIISTVEIPHESLFGIWNRIQTMSTSEISELKALLSICDHMLRLDRSHRFNAEIFQALHEFLLEHEDFENTSLAEVIRNSIELIQKISHIGKINFECDNFAETVTIDKNKLQLISLNLLQICLERFGFETSSPPIHIRLIDRDRQVGFSVERVYLDPRNGFIAGNASSAKKSEEANNNHTLNLIYLKNLVIRHEGQIEILDNDEKIRFDVVFPKAS